MPDAIAESLSPLTPDQEIVASPQSQNIQEKRVRLAGLKNAMQKASPRRVLEHFSKKDEQLSPDQEKALGGLAVGMRLIKEHGVAAASFAVVGSIALLPVFLGAPETATMVIQEGTLAATGAIAGVNIGGAVEKVTGQKRSKLTKAVHGAMGAAALMGVGHGAHEVGGDLMRGATAVGDEPGTFVATLGANMVADKVVSKKEAAARKVASTASVTPKVATNVVGGK